MAQKSNVVPLAVAGGAGILALRALQRQQGEGGAGDTIIAPGGAFSAPGGVGGIGGTDTTAVVGPSPFSPDGGGAGDDPSFRDSFVEGLTDPFGLGAALQFGAILGAGGLIGRGLARGGSAARAADVAGDAAKAADVASDVGRAGRAADTAGDVARGGDLFSDAVRTSNVALDAGRGTGFVADARSPLQAVARDVRVIEPTVDVARTTSRLSRGVQATTSTLGRVGRGARRALRVAGPVADVALSIPTFVQAGQTVGAAVTGDRQEVAKQASETVREGTRFLSAGTVSIQPTQEGAVVEAFGASREVRAPTSAREAGQNVQENLGRLGRGTAEGARRVGRRTRSFFRGLF